MTASAPPTTSAAALDRPAGSLLRGRILVFAAIAMSALTLRVAVTSFPPLASRISGELGFSSAVVGIFGMMPVAMFALFGLLTPALVRRCGLEATAMLAMVMAGTGMLTRAMVSETWLLLSLSALALGGMGIGNIVIPPLVKRYFGDRMALMSSIYITAMQIGTIVPALVAVPLADVFDWRISIGVWAPLGFAAAVPWLLIVLGGRRAGADAAGLPQTPRAPGRVWRSPVGWGMAGLFGTTSILTYAMLTWLPRIFTDAGASESFGGSMVALFSLVGLVSALSAPSVCTRLRNPFPVVVGGALCFLVGFVGMAVAPMAAPVLWVVILGFGPCTFPMSLVLINVRTRTPAGSASLSGFTQGIGYTVACVGPPMCGVLYELTGGWNVPFLGLGLAVVGGVVAGRVACKPRMLEDGWTQNQSRPAGS